MTFTIKGFKFTSPIEALRFAEADEGKAIRIKGLNLVVSRDEAVRLESLGIPFAYLETHQASVQAEAVH